MVHMCTKGPQRVKLLIEFHHIEKLLKVLFPRTTEDSYLSSELATKQLLPTYNSASTHLITLLTMNAFVVHAVSEKQFSAKCEAKAIRCRL